MGRLLIGLIVFAIIVLLIYFGVQIFLSGNSKLANYYRIIKNGKTMLPITDVVKFIGGTTKWDSASRKITILCKTTKVELWIGKNTALVNGTSIKINAKDDKIVPQIIGEKTCVPLNFILSSLGKAVVWDAVLEIIRKKVALAT